MNAIITKYPQVQLVNLSDSFANDAGKLNPQVEYIRLSLLSPFVHGKYRMGPDLHRLVFDFPFGR